jgi:hypothetical protein
LDSRIKLASVAKRPEALSQQPEALPQQPEELPQMSTTRVRVKERMATVYEKVQGSVAYVNLRAGLVRLQLPDGERLPPGTTVEVYHRYLTGTAVSATLKVTDSRPGSAEARLAMGHRTPKIARGDLFVAWK